VHDPDPDSDPCNGVLAKKAADEHLISSGEPYAMIRPAR
tara:strand:+ start:381 stop:497 length:117 start_codon:yes stop_codon:yes gene_type:complete